VVEWVDATTPFGVWLTGAYKSLRHKSFSPSDALDLAKAENEKRAGTAGRLATFRKILRQLPPVFRYFAFRHFHLPSDWYEARLRYTRSTAVASVLGYILGIGDRHSYNILLDKQNGEVIHIDLGIAFDMGKLLSVPELVPFRLTQNVVDGKLLMTLR
jgi:phosphatidylinositol kinase/protein kinase (PI-3  family)